MRELIDYLLDQVLISEGKRYAQAVVICIVRL